MFIIGKKGRLLLYLFTFAVISLTQAYLSPIANAAPTISVDFSDTKLPFTRINRVTFKIGEAWFYLSNPLYDSTQDLPVLNSVGLQCPATVTMKTLVSGGTANTTSWTISWTSPYESKEGCNPAIKTAVRDDTPQFFAERSYIVFYKDGDAIKSVLKDNKTTFKKEGNWGPEQPVYIEDTSPLECPSVIRYSDYDKKWAYIPMKKVDSDSDASDQYASLMRAAFDTPWSDAHTCTPTDTDSLGLFARFGLPENYYDRGNLGDSTTTILTDFGFRDAQPADNNHNKNLYGAILGGMPGKEVQGIGASGDNPNGAGIGDGKGVNGGPNAPGGDMATSTCTVEGVGWIICPVMNFMSKVNDILYNFLAEYFLEIKPTIFTSSTNKTGLYAAWDTFRGFANVLFVVAFLIIIYSQITSVGITNYGIKKLLPKLIIAAILVNTSYYISQLAVDISNITGYGIKSLFESIGGGTGAMSTFGTNPWGEVVGGALAVTAGIGIVLATSVPVLLAGLVSLLMVVVILIARQAIVILLIAISPLAFVAWLLPNTEKWFKKWWEVFFAMLMLFPIIGALYGAGILAATILGTGDFGPDGGVAKIAALGASILPLAVTIPVLRGSLKATGALGAKLSGWSQKASSGVGSKVKTESRLGRGVAGGLAHRAQNRAIRQTKAGAKWYNKAWMAPIGGKGYGKSLTNRAASLEDEEFEKGIKAAESNLGGKTFDDINAIANDKSASDIDRTAAVRHIMAKGNFAQRQALVEKSGVDMSARQRSAVSEGVISRGDHAIYGANIADAIKNGKIKGSADTKQFVAQNIAAGKVKAEAMVHDADAVKLMAEVTSGGGIYSLKDATTGVVTSRSLNTTEIDMVKDAAAKAQQLPGTASRVSKVFTDQYAQL